MRSLETAAGDDSFWLSPPGLTFFLIRTYCDGYWFHSVSSA